jgi:hypothetical protein
LCACTEHAASELVYLNALRIKLEEQRALLIGCQQGANASLPGDLELPAYRAKRAVPIAHPDATRVHSYFKVVTGAFYDN